MLTTVAVFFPAATRSRRAVGDWGPDARWAGRRLVLVGGRSHAARLFALPTADAREIVDFKPRASVLQALVSLVQSAAA